MAASTGKSKASLKFQAGPSRQEKDDDDDGSQPYRVVQHLPAVRQTYSYPGSVPEKATYDKFRFITGESMTKALQEAKKSMEEERYRRICGKKKMRPSLLDDAAGGNLCSDITRTYYDKWVKQVKWFWYEIEDYLREIETVYNEVRLHGNDFDNRKKDKEEENRRQRRASDFTARSCRIVYDLQQQIKDVFSALDTTGNMLSKQIMKKIHSIHRGAVMALQNLLTRLADFDLDRGLPQVYHQLAILIRRLAQCCYQLKFGHDVNMIRTLEGIRQKVEDASPVPAPELPLYRLAPTTKRATICPPVNVWKGPKPPSKTCPLVWQEFDYHSKGKRPPRDIPPKVMDMVDISTKQGYIAPVHLQEGIDKYLRIKSPVHQGPRSPRSTSKLLAKLKHQIGDNAAEEEFDAITRRLKKLQQDYISEVEGEITSRLRPLLQETKKDYPKKKVVNVGHVHVKHPRDIFGKHKVLLGYGDKVGSELHLKGPDQEVLSSGSEISTRRPRRSRSPITIKPHSARPGESLTMSSTERMTKPRTAGAKINSVRSSLSKQIVRSAQMNSKTQQIDARLQMEMTAGGDHVYEVSKTSKQTRLSSGKSGQTSTLTKGMPSRKERDHLVYMVHDMSDANGTGTPHEDTRSRKGPDELQWALQGSLSMWNPNQVDDILGKINDMEGEEQAIRQRWQDLIYMDPSITGAGSNYRVAYGESKDFSDNKEPDAIVLMKPSNQKETLVVVTALPQRMEEEPQQDNEGDEGSNMSTRARGGQDATRIYINSHYKNNIKSYCEKFDSYLRRTSHYAVGDFDPWKVVEDVADDILVDLFGDVADEVADIPAACVKDMYEAEFVQA